MKALVAAACIAVIAAVGYFFWSEFQAAQTAKRAAAFAVERRECLALFQRAEDERITPTEESIRKCLMSGAINQKDIDAALTRIRQKYGS